MSIEPESLTHSLSPLQGFDFTRDWVAGREFPRRYLAAADEVTGERLAALSGGAWTPWTSDEIAEVRDFNRAVGNDAGAVMAEELGKSDALVIVTGQQPDLLAAPLYVLHKALSACAWARRVSEEHGRPVVPVFWVASDDDDFAELKQAKLVTYKGELVDVGARMSRGRGLNAGTPAYSWSIAEGGPRLQNDIRKALTGWPAGDETAEWLAEQIKKHQDFESLFCSLLAHLLGPEFPVLFVAPRLKVFRRRQASVLSADIDLHGDLNNTISQAASEFQRAGYPVTLQRDADALNFFWLNNGRRHRLVEADGEVAAIDPQQHKEARRFTKDQLRELLNSEPESFAPNVVTRPVIQDVTLPTAAYIAGPGELAYLAVLGEAYDRFGCMRSAVIPRTLVTMDPQGILREWSGVEPPEHAADAVLSRGGGSAEILLDQVTDFMAEIAQNIERMRIASAGLAPEVQKALDKSERHLMHGIDQLKGRLARQAVPEEWNRAARLSTIMSPAGGAQERTLAPWNFVKAGEWDALARHLMSAVDYTATAPQTAPLPAWMGDAIL
jgi:bacillithiol biosynthesis cysteine-adding enzyme BshC